MLESALISSGGIWAVTIDFKWMTTLVAATSIAVLLVTLGVSAVTLEVAKKCDALAPRNFRLANPAILLRGTLAVLPNLSANTSKDA
jgi:hypothetical protein